MILLRSLLLPLLLSCAVYGQTTFQGTVIQGTIGGLAASLTSVTVAPLSASINVTKSQSFTATAHYSDGSTGNVTSASSWSASPPYASAELPTGTFLCNSAGTATITAAYQSQSGTASLTCTPLPQPSITTTSLPPGTQNSAYGIFCLTATGGTPPYTTWAETGTLPSGMSFNTSINTPVNGVAGGCLSGTPTNFGSFPLGFTVTDSAPQTSPQVNLTLTINPQQAGGGDDNQYCTTTATTTNNLTTWATTYPNGATMDGPAILPQACVNTALSQSLQTASLDLGWSLGRNVTVCPLSVGSCNFATVQAAMNAMSKIDASTGLSVGCGVTVKITANDGAGHQLTYAEGDGTKNGLYSNDVSGGYNNPQALVCPANNWAIFETDQIANASFPTEGTRLTPAAANITSLPDFPLYQGSVLPLVPKIISSAPPYYDGVHVNNCASTGCVSQSALEMSPMTSIDGTTCAATVNGIPQNPSHIRFIGIEFATSAAGLSVVDANGHPTSTFGSKLGLPCTATNIIFDRVYVHGGNTQSTLGWTQFENHIGINISSGSAVVNSTVTDATCWSGKGQPGTLFNGHTFSGMWGNCVDGQAVTAQSGGPIKVVNNFLSASGEPYWAGGQVPLPTDYEARRNHNFHVVNHDLDAPDFICQGGYTNTNGAGQDFAGISQTNCPAFLQHPDEKNIGEAKAVSRALYEGNVLDQIWPGADQPAGGDLLTPKNQSSYVPGPAFSDGAGTLSVAANVTGGLNKVTNAFSPGNQLSNTTGFQSPSTAVASYFDPTAPAGQSMFARVEYPAYQLWQVHPTSTTHTNGFSCSNPNANNLWAGTINSDPTCSTGAPATGGSCTTPDPITSQCYWYPSVFVAGFPGAGDGWFITQISSNSSGLVTASVLSCQSGTGNVIACTGADSTHDIASPPWTAAMFGSQVLSPGSGGTPYTVQWPFLTGSNPNPAYPTTGFTGGGMFNVCCQSGAPIAGFNLQVVPGGFTFFFHDATHCPTVNGNNDCFTYQSSTNSVTATGGYTYKSAGQTFTIFGEFGLYPPSANSTHYKACAAGNDFTANINNVTFRYNHIMHANEALVFSSPLSDCGDASNGMHEISVHDDLGDDLDGGTYGTFKGTLQSKISVGSNNSVSQAPTQLNTCSTDTHGNTSCTLTTVTNCSRSGATATITTSAPHGFVTGQTVLVGGPQGDIGFAAGAYNSTTANGTIITAVPANNQISYAISGTPASGACSGSIFYPSSLSDITINHVTLLPGTTLLQDKRALRAPGYINTTNMSSFNLGSSAPLAYVVNYTVLNSIGYGGFYSVPANNSFPNQCTTNKLSSIPTLNCVAGNGGNGNASWCVNNNILTGATIPQDPYCSNPTVCPSFPGIPAYPNNGLLSPLPGDVGFTTQPGAGLCPSASAATTELTDYTSIGFTNLADAGTCYAFQPGTPVLGGGSGCAQSPFTGTNPGVPNYKLLSSTPYINGSLAYSTPFATGGSWASDNSTVTAWSMNGSNVLSLTAAGNSFTNGQKIWISGFPQTAATNWMNGQLVTVSGTGATFTVTGLTHALASGSDHGCASVNGYCDIGANIDIINTVTQGVY
jgi:hypothetical protein